MTAPHDDGGPPPEDFDELEPEAGHLLLLDESAATEPDWARALARSPKGQVTKEAGNVVIILYHTAAWRGRLRHDVVRDRVQVHGLPPLPHMPEEWPSMPVPTVRELDDDHVVYVAQWLRRMWRQSWSTDVCRAAIGYVARQNPIDPIAEYLDECAGKWDGKRRVDRWLIDYLGAPPLPVNLRIGAMWLLSAVARARKPGAKVDHVLVLEGDQGRGKNKALELLFGDEHYLPELPDVRNKDAMHVLSGAWCACIDELCAIRAADQERVKSFLSRRVDHYRPAYARDTVQRARRTVFAATTNVPEYLTDPTGNRRYWPVACGAIDHDALARDRDQIWGEAAHRFATGETWWPDDSDTIALQAVQSEREQRDEWDEVIAEYLEGLQWVTVGSCLSHLGIERADWRPADQHRAARALTRAGWEPKRQRCDDGRPRRHWAPR